MNTLAGKIALVTGGAGGIGSAICRKLASEGASVIITYNSKPEKAKHLYDELQGENHSIFHAPVHDSKALEKPLSFYQRKIWRFRYTGK